MNKVDYKKELEKLRKKVEKQTQSIEKLASRKKPTPVLRQPSKVDDKICPLMSDAYTPVACTSRCKIFCKNRSKGFECVLQDLMTISWRLGSTKKNDKK